MNGITIAVVAFFALLASIFACGWLAEPKRAAKRRLERLATWPKAFRYRKLVAMVNVNFSGQDKTHERALNRTPDATITVRHLLYKKGTDNQHIAAIAAQTDVPLGVVADEWASGGQPVALQLLGVNENTIRMVANASGLAIGDIVFSVATGYVDKAANLTGSSSAYQVGVIVDIPNQTTTAAQGDIVEVASCPPVKVAT